MDSSARVPPVTVANCLSFSSSLEFRPEHAELHLGGLGLETCLPVRIDPSRTASGLAARPDHPVSDRPARSELAFYSTKHLHRHRPPFLETIGQVQCNMQCDEDGMQRSDNGHSK